MVETCIIQWNLATIFTRDVSVRVVSWRQRLDASCHWLKENMAYTSGDGLNRKKRDWKYDKDYKIRRRTGRVRYGIMSRLTWWMEACTGRRSHVMVSPNNSRACDVIDGRCASFHDVTSAERKCGLHKGWRLKRLSKVKVLHKPISTRDVIVSPNNSRTCDVIVHTSACECIMSLTEIQSGLHKGWRLKRLSKISIILYTNL